MNEPTQEQIKRFWGWCGFGHIPAKYCRLCERWEGEYWLKKEIGRKIYRPQLLVLDLNSLFKYAVPKVRETNEIAIIIPPDDKDRFRIRIGHNQVVENKDPVLALFWAIYKAAGLE